MRLVCKVITVELLVLLLAVTIACNGAFSVPSLFNMPIINSLRPQTELVSPELPAQAAEELFSLSLSGNVYYDKIPVSGAEVSIYLNGRYKGKTTAGDIYIFKVPGVKIGDTIRVDASYNGYKGSASDVVKFKSMYLDVTVRTDRSFIRTALEMLPTSEDLRKSSGQPATASTQTPASTGSTGTQGNTGTTADAGQLTKQIWSDTSNLIGATAGK